MTAYLITLAILALIAALLGFALNLQWGTAGLVNFGLAGFFALGAYTAALTALAGAGSFLAIAAAALVCALACAATISTIAGGWDSPKHDYDKKSHPEIRRTFIQLRFPFTSLAPPGANGNKAAATNMRVDPIAELKQNS